MSRIGPLVHPNQRLLKIINVNLPGFMVGQGWDFAASPRRRRAKIACHRIDFGLPVPSASCAPGGDSWQHGVAPG